MLATIETQATQIAQPSQPTIRIEGQDAWIAPQENISDGISAASAVFARHNADPLECKKANMKMVRGKELLTKEEALVEPDLGRGGICCIPRDYNRLVKPGYRYPYQRALNKAVSAITFFAQHALHGRARQHALVMGEAVFRQRYLDFVGPEFDIEQRCIGN